MKGKLGSKEPEKTDYIGRGLALGLAIGAGWGVALSAATDNPGMLAIGVGCGISLGVAIGSSLQRRHEVDGEDGAS
jgi:hypothetical protein